MKFILSLAILFSQTTLAGVPQATREIIGMKAAGGGRYQYVSCVARSAAGGLEIAHCKDLGGAVSKDEVDYYLRNKAAVFREDFMIEAGVKMALSLVLGAGAWLSWKHMGKLASGGLSYPVTNMEVVTGWQLAGRAAASIGTASAGVASFFLASSAIDNLSKTHSTDIYLIYDPVADGGDYDNVHRQLEGALWELWMMSNS